MDKTLTLRFTSDTHGYLYPISYADRQERPIGLMKLASEFPHDGNTLILDGGDTIQGSPLTNYYHRLSDAQKRQLLPGGVHPVAAMMNLAGYQFVTLGNHDFNYGVQALYDYLRQLDAQCLCCNIRDRAGRLPIAPYAVHQLENGLRVGLVGACTPYVARWENPKTVQELFIEEPVPACAKALEAVRAQCDLTVLIYHGGFECDLTTGKRLTESRENEAFRICHELDFDLVLTGHQHMRLPGMHVGNSYVVQPAYRAPHACAVTVTLHDDGSKSFSSALLPAVGEPLPEAARLLAPLEAQVQNWLDTPAGHLDLPLTGGDHLTQALCGSPLANFINTVQLAASGAQVSACSLPNEFKGLPTTVTIRDVVSTYIYTNTLVVLELNRAALKRYMERSAMYFELDEGGKPRISEQFLVPKVEHYNYDYFSGVDYTLDLRRPMGERVTSIRLGGRELNDTDTVSVCINSYRACGTGGYDFLTGQKVLADIQTDVADAMIEYIMTHPQIHVDRHRYCTLVY